MKNIQQLLNLAQKAMENAYAPYSKLRVGAAIIADNGKIYCGCNTENISYPCGTCAETGAIAAMVADGGRLIQQIVIVSDSKTMITPCGACLQRIKEFADTNTEIVLFDTDQNVHCHHIDDLLPHAFEEF